MLSVTTDALLILVPPMTFPSFNRFRKAVLCSICMTDTKHHESLRLFGLTFYAAMKGNGHIESTTRCVARNGGWLCHARHSVLTDSLLHTCKSVIRVSIKYCCHIWPGASELFRDS